MDTFQNYRYQFIVAGLFLALGILFLLYGSEPVRQLGTEIIKILCLGIVGGVLMEKYKYRKASRAAEKAARRKQKEDFFKTLTTVRDDIDWNRLMLRVHVKRSPDGTIKLDIGEYRSSMKEISKAYFGVRKLYGELRDTSIFDDFSGKDTCLAEIKCAVDYLDNLKDEFRDSGNEDVLDEKHIDVSRLPQLTDFVSSTKSGGTYKTACCNRLEKIAKDLAEHLRP